MTKYFLIVIAILLFALAGLTKIWFVTLKDRNRISDNQSALLSEIQYFKLNDSTNAATIGSLTLKLSEIKQASNTQFDAMKATLKLLDIKLRNLDSYSSSEFENLLTINTFLRDSVLLDTLPVKYLYAKSKWNEVTVSVFPERQDSISLKVITYDKMEQVLWKEGRGLKFWKKSFWRKRPIHQTIRFQNPDTKITYPFSVIVK
ncbi:MAG TPA: hypothetical protein PKM34_02485 [Bacteroidales bacterium]|nr:hypothetical protein [Bacteroidales bacterium]